MAMRSCRGRRRVQARLERRSAEELQPGSASPHLVLSHFLGHTALLVGDRRSPRAASRRPGVYRIGLRCGGATRETGAWVRRRAFALLAPGVLPAG